MRILIGALLSFAVACAGPSENLARDAAPKASDTERPQWRLVIHGGAGVILRENLTDEQEAAYRAALNEALQAGAAILAEGGTAVDAVQAAVIPMEDNPLFNAGVGSVYTAAEEHELDASIMDGRDRNAGSVAGLKRVKNPVLAARAVMDQSEHVMFAGEGADAFAEAIGLEMVDNTHFNTERRLESLQSVLERRRERTSAEKAGTVGAIAIDQDGNVAATTTTGGMTAKAAGRIGDAPLIGAATYAQNGVCAVSATGHGEYFIRVGVAKTICARVELAGDTIGDAAQDALDQVAALGGDGGVIVMDGNGEYEYIFNSPGMYRGMIDPEGSQTAIFAKTE
ncbi:MAG: isoaspartyl peptidase/L-asparaginase [Pseudomonadota bacterium]